LLDYKKQSTGKILIKENLLIIISGQENAIIYTV